MYGPNELRFAVTNLVSLRAMYASAAPGDMLAQQTARLITELEEAATAPNWSTFELRIERSRDNGDHLIQRATVIGMRN